LQKQNRRAGDGVGAGAKGASGQEAAGDFSRDTARAAPQHPGPLNVPLPPSTPRPLAGVLAAVALLGLALVGRLQGAGEWPQRVRDALGREVTIPAAPRRVISLTPANTEILFAIGAGDRVVGVTTWCNFPAEARTRAKVGGFAATTIHLETLVALQPDLVVAGDETQRQVIESVARLGFPVLAVKVRDFPALYTVTEQLGRLCEAGPAAAALVAGLRRRVDDVVARSAGIPADRRPRVYWEVFDAPVMSAGRGSMIGQLIELAGGVNVFADVREEYPQVSTEAVVARAPEVILGPDMIDGGALTVARLRARPGWSAIPAVRTGRVHVLPADPTSRPGPRLVDGLELVAAVLYPPLPSNAEGRQP
jgi:iron complex transport system substrate-binding protein